MRRLIVLAVFAATLLVASPASASAGLHVAPTADADPAGCHGLDVWNGDQIIDTLPPDDGEIFSSNDDVYCAFNGWSFVLPNGLLIFDWNMDRIDMYGHTSDTVIWGTDGSQGVMRKLSELTARGCGFTNIEVVDQTAFISGSCYGSSFITATRGTRQSTFGLPGGRPGTYTENGLHRQHAFYARTGKLIVYSADTRNQGRELFVSDGTRNGSHLLKDINPGRNSSDIRALFSSVSYATFSATDGHDRVRWWTNGVTVHKVKPS